MTSGKCNSYFIIPLLRDRPGIIWSKTFKTSSHNCLFRLNWSSDIWSTSYPAIRPYILAKLYFLSIKKTWFSCTTVEYFLRNFSYSSTLGFPSSFSDASLTALVTLLILSTEILSEHFWHFHEDSIFEVSVDITLPAWHFGHLRQLEYVPNSVGSAHLLQPHWNLNNIRDDNGWTLLLYHSSLYDFYHPNPFVKSVLHQNDSESMRTQWI